LIKQCESCGAEFRAKWRSRDNRYERACSITCAAKLRNVSGNKNPNWRDAGKKICCQCGVEFKNYNKARKYCNAKCRDIANGNLKRGKPNSSAGKPRPKARHPRKPPKMCIECGKNQTRTRQSKYCINCGPKGAFRTIRTCVVCGEQFRHWKVKKTCGAVCRKQMRTIVQIGEKSHRWRGGRTSENTRLRNSIKALDWRKAIFARDDFKCVMCGQRGGKLHADHIKPWSLYPELRFDLTNGRTLCRPCHIYKSGTWGYATSQQVFRGAA
jgi:hypothetical protein